MKTKSIEETLRDLVKEKGLRKTAHALGIDHASLYRSLKDGSNIKLGRVKKILEYCQYEIKFAKKKVSRNES